MQPLGAFVQTHSETRYKPILKVSIVLPKSAYCLISFKMWTLKAAKGCEQLASSTVLLPLMSLWDKSTESNIFVTLRVVYTWGESRIPGRRDPRKVSESDTSALPTPQKGIWTHTGPICDTPTSKEFFPNIPPTSTGCSQVFSLNDSGKRPLQLLWCYFKALCIFQCWFSWLSRHRRHWPLKDRYLRFCSQQCMVEVYYQTPLNTRPRRFLKLERPMKRMMPQR